MSDSAMADRRTTSAGGTMAGVAFEPRAVVRVGMWGAGHRGIALAEILLRTAGVELTCIVDPSDSSLARMRDHLSKGGAGVEFIEQTDGDVAEVVDRLRLDLVVVAAPWSMHRPLAVAAMEAGAHVAVEVSPARTIDDCWQLVETSERTRRHCMMLENCCYGYNELMVLRMVRAGLFGQLLHAEAGYLHDLRHQLLTTHAWRRTMHSELDGNLYPTHGLGPVASYLDINRGDRFTTLVSMSSSQLGLDLMRDEMFGDDERLRAEVWRAGDVNTSLLRTEAGRTVLLQHHVVGPRPYERLNAVVGTSGVFRDFPGRFFLAREEEAAAGRDAEYGDYASVESYSGEWEHDLWRGRGPGGDAHGGMDTIMIERVVEAMRIGRPPDIDVYDAATWTAPTILSDHSVRAGSAPVEFPDFTRGAGAAVRQGIP